MSIGDPGSSYAPPDLSLFGDEHVRRYLETGGKVGRGVERRHLPGAVDDRLPFDGPVLGADTSYRRSDTWTVITLPYAEDCGEVFSGGGRLSAESGDAPDGGDLRHSKGELSHRDDLDRLGKHEEVPAKLAASLSRPGASQGSAWRGNNAPAEPVKLKTGRGRLMLVEDC
jgi:hypothetical protein